MDLRATNPTIPLGTYKENRTLYEGFSDPDTIKGFLTQHPFESNGQYNVRVKRAVYRNFAALVANVFSSGIFAGEVTRDLPESCLRYADDVNEEMDGADVFFQAVADESAALGVSFVLVNKSATDAKTQAEEQAAGARPYFTMIQPESVVDFGDGYAVIRSTQWENDGTPGSKYSEQTYYEVWTSTDWKRYVEVVRDGTRVVEEIGGGTHSLGSVPLVPFYFKRKSEFVGTAAIKDIVGLVKKLFRLDSEHDKQLFDAAVAFLLVKGMPQEDVETLVKSSSNALVTQNTDADAKYIETSGTSFSAIRDQIKDTETAIREIALRIVRPQVVGAESAESRRLDKQPLNSMFSVFSKNTEDSEAKCWYFMDKWSGGTGDGIAVTYNRDFDYQEITSQLLSALDGMTTNRTLSKATLYEIMQQRGIMPHGFDADDEALRISKEGFGNPTFELST